jgi:hypothetical protein
LLLLLHKNPFQPRKKIVEGMVKAREGMVKPREAT